MLWFAFTAERLYYIYKSTLLALSRLPTTEDGVLLTQPFLPPKNQERKLQFKAENKHKKGKKMEAAVVNASHGAMASLLEKLCDLLTDNCMLLKETKEQIVFLKDELENMYEFLKKMSDTEDPDEQAKCWPRR